MPSVKSVVEIPTHQAEGGAVKVERSSPEVFRGSARGAFVHGASALALNSGAVYAPNMSSVHEIETAVSKLSRQELLAFRDWFSEFDAAMWDKQFEEDVAAGHLDTLADEAIRDLREGRCRDL